MHNTLSVFQVSSLEDIDLSIKPLHIGVTDDEISVVTPTDKVSDYAINRDDDWKMLKVEGVLDFSLVGILSNISGSLAKAKVSIFSISTTQIIY